MIESCRRAVVFTGAGISTESGIPDFRSPGGIWTKYQPIEFQDFLASADMRRESWRRKFATESVVGEAEPNRGHRAVAKLVARGVVTAVVTQNIDGLHQKSGVPDSAVIELHGNATYAGCLDCGARHELAPIRAAFKIDETLPVCDHCGGTVKTATISFGQSMPEAEMSRAEQVTLACDLFIAVGSSLVVFPAAGFPVMAKRNGAKLVIVNRDPTDLDSMADLVLNRDIGPTLGEIAGVN
ncbi:MAG: Sir2 family NAD-dependent protein deacetylase [Alphaproteobacteria bacterium]|nr:Sir2 family NAD-dependent protein deacetylase [Alphaproteobacteria bacterium]MDP6515422.1 Sir2 family NAD-dependent protein deacetylase [Alphaproteobacteria bacterium]